MQNPITARAIQTDLLPIAIGQSEAHKGLHELVFAATQISSDLRERGRNGRLVGEINAGLVGAVSGLPGGSTFMLSLTTTTRRSMPFAEFTRHLIRHKKKIIDVLRLGATLAANLSQEGCRRARTDGRVTNVYRIGCGNLREKKLCR